MNPHLFHPDKPVNEMSWWTVAKARADRENKSNDEYDKKGIQTFHGPHAEKLRKNSGLYDRFFEKKFGGKVKGAIADTVSNAVASLRPSSMGTILKQAFTPHFIH